MSQGPFQTRILEVPTTFGNENDGVWRMADWDRDGIPDLVFIKTNNTPNGHVEVHIASGRSNYQTRVLEVPTTFGNENDGTWLMADWDRDGIPDLVFIKTNNTPNGHVEVHIASGKSNYQTRVLEVPTTFGNENDGTWLMADWDRDGIPDLVFIKTNNTPNRHVEVHIASGKSNYQTRILEVPTTFANENDGTWCMTDWDRDGLPDLVFIKTNNTPNGHVEVHIASGRSNFQTRVIEVPTTFVNETDGTWLMADWDRDRVPDLVFVKTSNTPNGHVEVHVASGQSLSRVLALNEQHQQQTEWCWSATTVSITKFYTPSTPWTQCSLVNNAFGQTTCCQNGSSAACNIPWYPDKALTITGHLASTSSGKASLTTIENEINAGHPISIAIYWNGGGGHNPAIDGYDVSNPSAPTIDIQDPWYGHSTQDFNTFPSTYNGGASWGVNYFTK